MPVTQYVKQAGVFCFGLLHEFTDVNLELDVKAVMMEIERVFGSDGFRS